MYPVDGATVAPNMDERGGYHDDYLGVRRPPRVGHAEMPVGKWPQRRSWLRALASAAWTR